MKFLSKAVLTTLCCLPIALAAQTKYSLQGNIGKSNQTPYVHLSYKEGGVDIQDSVKVKNGKFAFQGKLQAPILVMLQIKNSEGKKGNTDFIQFYLENSKITLNSKDSLKNAKITGSQTNDENIALRAMQRPFKKSADSLVAVYYKLTPEQRKDTSFTVSAGKIMRATQIGYDSVSRFFISTHLNSPIALSTFKEVELAHNFNPDTAALRFSKFSEAMQSSEFGKKLQSTIDIGKRTNVGVIAMDFEQLDSLGNPVKLSDFRGKYVLLDFWASWCVPCRAENPIMLAAYNKFNDKNFTILGVSLDDEKSRKAWINAVKMDGIPWIQVSELKGFGSKAAVDYGVSAIPTNFLIDPSGKIVARNLRGQDLEKVLANLLGSD